MRSFNQILLLALAAFAACQLAVAASVEGGLEVEEEGFSQAAAANSDSETGLLLGDERLFSDFCKDQRDYVLGDLKQTVRETSAQMFRAFFGQFNGIADEVLDVERQAVEELSKQMEFPDTPVSDGPLPEDQVAALIEEGKRTIASKTDVTYGLKSATQAALSAIYSTVNSAIFIRLAKARSAFSAQTFMQAFEQNCGKVAEYEQILEQNFAAAKEQIKENASAQSFIDSVTLNSLHCQTTKNVVRLNAFCRLIKTGSGPFLKMLGINSQYLESH